MLNRAKSHILVTGAHRSGSTWLGTILSEAKKVRYVHEPFSPIMGYEATPISEWFEFVSDRCPSHFQLKTKKYLESFVNVSYNSLYRQVRKVRNSRDLYLLLADHKGRISDRSVIKDPIAVLSTEWIYRNLPVDVVISIRHPAAFVASVKKKDWEHDFNSFVRQKELMKRLPEDFRTKVEEFSINRKSIIEQATLLWMIIHEFIAQYRENYGSKWYFVRHEDLSRKALSEFEQIFNFLGLEFDDRVKEKIIISSTATNESELSRDSLENIYSWKKRLTSDEIAYIKEEARPIWSKFYSESDW